MSTVLTPHKTKFVSADGTSEISVCIVAHSPILRAGLTKLLGDTGFRVTNVPLDTAPASTVELLRACGADIAILDGWLCRQSPQLAPLLSQAITKTRLVILADEDAMSRISDETIGVVDGILASDLPSEVMIQSLRSVRLGVRVVSPQLLAHSPLAKHRLPAKSWPFAAAAGAPHQALSPRETEILRYLLAGCSNKVIARHLAIKEATVKVHVKGLLRKTRAANRTQAAIWAMNNGIDPAGTHTRANAAQASPVAEAYND